MCLVEPKLNPKKYYKFAFSYKNEGPKTGSYPNWVAFGIVSAAAVIYYF
jgi:hypothetical protein